MNEELKNLIKVWSFALISISYCYYVSTRIKAGVFRLLSVLPVFALFLVLPLFLSSVHFSASTAFFLSWLANFRLLLFSFGKNSFLPLPLNLFRFICFTCVPFPQQSPNPKTNFSQWEVAIEVLFDKQFAVKVAILGAVLHMYDHKQHLYPIVLLCLYPLHLYLVLEILLNLFNALLFMALDFDFEPQLNEPYLATSLEEFWCRWWNLMVPEIIWQFFYPNWLITEWKMTYDQAVYLGVITSFLVSGALHELLFIYITREPPTGEVTMFFVLHGLCMVVEMRLKKKIMRLKLKTFVSQVIVVGFVVVTSGWLFFPPLVRSGKIQKLGNEALFFDPTK
ncbi:putative long-chain-alcohol O-fatty-acyltransferase 11 [Cardamine amara subsp. amara]|uniref:long-chain-alcohol O-fatty-acyltransferase n=1 Tax=Cardamine amara subsp. amara TaxID=228776 RepID=A0ABD1BYI6_CARAN